MKKTTIRISVDPDPKGWGAMYPHVRSVTIEVECQAEDDVPYSDISGEAMGVLKTMVTALQGVAKKAVPAAKTVSKTAPQAEPPKAAPTATHTAPARSGSMPGEIVSVKKVKSQYPPGYQYYVAVDVENGALRDRVSEYLYPSEINKLLKETGVQDPEDLIGVRVRVTQADNGTYKFEVAS